MGKSRVNNTKTVVHSVLSKEELTQAIVEAKQRILQKEKDEQAAAKAEWRRNIGFDDNLTGIKQAVNFIPCILKLLLFPKKYQDTHDVLGIRFLLTMFLSAVFSIVEFSCVLTPFIVVYQFITQNMPTSNFLISFILSLVMVCVSRFFRMARYEVEDLADRESLFMVFSAVVSIIAVISAVNAS